MDKFITEMSPKNKKTPPYSPKRNKDGGTRAFFKDTTSSFPSPLDRIFDKRRERANQLGLTPPLSDSFLLNQSFPRQQKNKLSGNVIPRMGDVRKCNLDKFRGDALNSFNFSSVRREKTSLRYSGSYGALNTSFGFVYSNHVAASKTSNGVHQNQVQNPSKAVITIDTKTTEILVANKMACVLLGLNPGNIDVKKLCDYFLPKKDQFCLGDAELKNSGELVVISGKVMDIVLPNDGKVIPVSVWARRLENENENRCLIVMEQVNRTTGSVYFDSSGKIKSCDKNFANLYGYILSQDIEGFNVATLIPSIVLPSQKEVTPSIPKAIQKQRATGRTKDGTIFPLSVLIEPYSIGLDSSDDFSKDSSNDNSMSLKMYKGTVWVFTNISGLITVLPDGSIHSCNTNFSLMLFGYSQTQLIGKNITMLIPSFYDDLEFLDTDSMPLPILDDDDDDSNTLGFGLSDGRTTADSIGGDPPRPMNPLGRCLEFITDDSLRDTSNLNISPSSLKSQFLPCDFPSPFDMRSSPLKSIDEDSFDSLLCEPSTSIPDLRPLSPTKEVSESSSQCIESLKQLSISESQDTLHSCGDSITESDINANIFEASGPDITKKKSTSKQNKLSLPKECIGNSTDDLSSNCSSLVSEDGSYVSGTNENGPLSPFPSPLHKASKTDAQLSMIDCCNPEHGDEHIPDCFPMNHCLLNEQPIVNSTPKNDALAEKITSMLTSVKSEDSFHSIPEGCYFGVGRHQDGSDLAIIYHVTKVELEDDSFLYCLWVARDPKEVGEIGRSFRTLTLASSHTSALSQTPDNSNLGESYNSDLSCSTVSSIDVPDSVYTSGPYSEHYAVLEQIGKGAFGCVKKARR